MPHFVKLIFTFSAVQLWPLASLINYRFVPVKLRVLFVNCVAFLWYALRLMPPALSYDVAYHCCPC